MRLLVVDRQPFVQPRRGRVVRVERGLVEQQVAQFVRHDALYLLVRALSRLDGGQHQGQLREGFAANPFWYVLGQGLYQRVLVGVYPDVRRALQARAYVVLQAVERP